MRNHNEKSTNEFWLRPAFQRNSFATKWRSLNNRTIVTTPLIIFSFLLLGFILVFAGWIDLASFSGQVSPGPLETSIKKPEVIIEYPLKCTTWNETNKCPSNNYPKKHQPSLNSTTSTCPEYFKWIYEDLKQWKETGITREMVEGAKKHAHFRLVILDGKIYVEKFRESIQTRALFTMWGIVQLLRFYPGKLPDLELMFDCDDRPVISAKDYNKPNAAAPPPLFRYCSNVESLDIVFPDWSFWGWAETNIKPWRITLNDIKEGNKRSKWVDRVPLAYWKGNPHVDPGRKDLLRCNVTDKQNWNTLLYVQDWNQEAKVGYKQSSLEDQCTHRYKIYIEGWVWSVSEKYILACDSPTFVITPRYHDFFMRGMVPQKHYWPVRENDKCKSLKFGVDWGNNLTNKAQAIGEAGSHFIHEDMNMDYIYDFMFHILNEYSKLLKFKPSLPQNAIELCSEALACPADGNWRKFMEVSLEKSPRSSEPCTLPPPYDPQGLKGFNDEKFKFTREVEGWENQFYDNLNKKQ